MVPNWQDAERGVVQGIFGGSNHFNCMCANWLRIVASGSMLALSTACGIFEENDRPTLSIHNKNLTLTVGDTTSLAVVFGQGVPPVSTSSAGYGGNLEAAKQIRWRISDSSVARIDVRGGIVALRAGTTFAHATIEDVSDSTRLAVVTPHSPAPEFAAIGTGAAHACALTRSGVVHCWGSNWLGELGQGRTDRFVLTVSPTAIALTQPFSMLAVGHYHNCALSTEGFVYCWGDNAYGQLGRNAPARSGLPNRLETGHRFTGLAAGGHTTCGITNRTTIVCWGKGQDISIEYSAASEGGYVSVTVGSEHQCALTASGRILCWGSNGYGELGNGATVSAATPTPISSGERFKSVSAGSNYSCAVSVSSSAFCWGHGFNGKLGSGVSASSATPVRVAGDYAWREVDAGADHSCATTNDGIAYCWGGDALEELGNGPNASDERQHFSLVPTAVLTAQRFEQISASPDNFSCGITSDRHAYCWGSNNAAGLGIGWVSRNGQTHSSRAVPTLLARFLHR